MDAKSPALELILPQIPQVELDNEGKFKYILIKCQINKQEPFYFVRGYNQYEYHAENFSRFFEDLKSKIQWTKIEFNEDDEKDNIIGEIGVDKFQFDCPGGGRVIHSVQNKIFTVFGYSQSYGKADHDITLQVLRNNTKYPQENYKLGTESY